MEKRQFGKTGMNVSVLGFGGAEIGADAVSQDEATLALNQALDAGVNVIDTAECYGGSEEKIGNAISHRRSDFYLFTKLGHSSGFEEPDWNIDMLRKSIDRSLKRLKTDCVDLLQIHSCDADLLQKGEVIQVVQDARKAGKTKFIGYSGDNEDAKVAIGLEVFDSLQTSLNIADQSILEENLALAHKNKMGVIIKRPIANAAWKYETLDSTSYYYTYWHRLKELKYDFLNGSDVASTALRFTMSQLGVCTMIVGTSKAARILENRAAVDLGVLDSEKLGKIRDQWKKIAQESWCGQR